MDVLKNLFDPEKELKYYVNEDGEAVLTDYTGNRTILYLPNIIDGYNVCSVIPFGSFESAKSVRIIVCDKTFKFEDFIFQNSSDMDKIITYTLNNCKDIPTISEFSFSNCKHINQYIPVAKFNNSTEDETFINAYKSDDFDKMDSLCQEIPIPIKKFVLDSMQKHDIQYENYGYEMEIFLRRYFIGGLNISLFKPSSLIRLIDRFTSKVKRVEFVDLIDKSRNEDYCLDRGILSICSRTSFDNSCNGYKLLCETYEDVDEDSALDIRVYKAITKCIIFDDENNETIEDFINCISNMIANQIYAKEINDCILLPYKRSEFELCGVEHVIIKKYYNNHISSRLTEQLFHLLDTIEWKFYQMLFDEYYPKIINEFKDIEHVEDYLSMIGTVYNIEISDDFSFNNILLLDEILEKFQKRYYKVIDERYPNQEPINLLRELALAYLTNDKYRTIA